MGTHAAYLHGIGVCCCKSTKPACTCDNLAAYFGANPLPPKLIVHWNHQGPEVGKCVLECAGGNFACCTNHDTDQEYCCNGPEDLGKSEYNTHFYSDIVKQGGLCDFAGCAEYSDKDPTECVDCYTGDGAGYADSGEDVETAREWQGCYRDCSPMNGCNSHTHPSPTADMTGGRTYSGPPSLSTNPITEFYAGGEIHLKKKSKYYDFLNDGQGGYGPYYGIDEDFYAPYTLGDTVEWGDPPGVVTGALGGLYLLYNMYNTVSVGGCFVPGMDSERGTMCPRHKNISARVGATLSMMEQGGGCGWSFGISHVDDVHYGDKCMPGLNFCGSLPDTNDPDECACNGKICVEDSECFIGEGSSCCRHQFTVGATEPFYDNVGDDPCDQCEGFNCCGCQRGLHGSTCKHWGGEDGGLTGDKTAVHMILFGTRYYPDDNYDCFSSPFDDTSQHGPHGTAPGWGGPPNPYTGDPGGNPLIPNLPGLGGGVSWGAAQTPKKFWQQKQGNEGFQICRSATFSSRRYTFGTAYGMLHITDYEAVWE